MAEIPVSGVPTVGGRGSVTTPSDPFIFFCALRELAAIRFVKGSRSSTTLDALRLFMNEKTRYQNHIELLQGTLDMLILRTLQWGPRHGHGIGQMIRTNSDDVLKIETGSLYPALHRLERQGWLRSEWGTTENNQQAKYYRLTAAGKEQLLAEQSRWHLLVKAIAGVMDPAQ